MMFKLHSIFNKYLAEEGGGEGDATGGAPEGDATGGAPEGDAADTTNTDTEQNNSDTLTGGEGNESNADANSGEGEGDASENGDNDTGDYADFVMPDGMDIDQGMLDAFAPAMKELGLTQEQAQGLVDIQAKQVQAQQQGVNDAYSQQLEDWLSESMADKDIGGDKFEESAGNALKAITQFGSPEFQTLLNDTGLGRNIEMIRLLSKVGLAISEDNPGGGLPQNKAKDTVSIMYPDTPG